MAAAGPQTTAVGLFTLLSPVRNRLVTDSEGTELGREETARLPQSLRMLKVRDTKSLPLKRLALLYLTLFLSVSFVAASSGDKLNVFIQCKRDW